MAPNSAPRPIEKRHEDRTIHGRFRIQPSRTQPSHNRFTYAQASSTEVNESTRR
jgi:hypothetical protein